jgi:hypothetical protein
MTGLGERFGVGVVILALDDDVRLVALDAVGLGFGLALDEGLGVRVNSVHHTGTKEEMSSSLRRQWATYLHVKLLSENLEPTCGPGSKQG